MAYCYLLIGKMIIVMYIIKFTNIVICTLPYAYLSTAGKRKYLPNLQATLGKPILKKEASTTQHLRCPICNKGTLRTVCLFTSRGPPPHWIKRIEKEKNSLKK